MSSTRSERRLKLAFARSYEDFGSLVYSTAVGLCGRADADDVTSRVFFQLWWSPRHLLSDTAAQRAFLVRMARREALRRIRSAAPDERDSSTSAVKLADRLCEMSMSSAARDVVVSLPTDERTVFALVHLGGCSLREVCELVGRSSENVIADLDTALRRVRSLHADA